MVEGIPAYEIGSKNQAVGRKMNQDEAEALASKEGEMKSLCAKKDRTVWYRMHDRTLTLQGGFCLKLTAHIADGFEYCANEEEGQMEEGVPAYEVKVCVIM